MDVIVDMDKWERKKKRIFERDGYKCQKCLRSNVPLMVLVHQYVKGIPIEENRDIDMYTICEECYRKS